MVTIRTAFEGLPLLIRAWLTGALVGGLLGGLTGLIIGLNASPRTAWFAAVEVGGPVGVAGALIGLAVGASIKAARGV